jgi:hypothetical protein
MPENNAKKLRSQEWWGSNDDYYNFARRAWMRSEGFAPDAFRGKPVVGICNSWSELNNCNTHLRTAPKQPNVIVNGATGAYGSAAVLVPLGMGAARVVAAGRNKEVLESLAKGGGPRVVPVKLAGDVEKDTATLRAACGGGAKIRTQPWPLLAPYIDTAGWCSWVAH